MLTARDVTLSFGPRTVLSGVDLVVAPGERVGLVAPNGVGKSTLLRVLAGELTPDSGTVAVRGAVAHLTQETDLRPGESLRDHLARRVGVAAVERRFAEATAALTGGAAGAEERYARAFDEWTASGAPDFTERAEEVCARLGLPSLSLSRPLSGGQSARLRLASVLLAAADVLLLDEPTNDLDLDGLAVLETHVLQSPAAVVLVSHDREFLARTTTAVARVGRVHARRHGVRRRVGRLRAGAGGGAAAGAGGVRGLRGSA